METFTYLQPNPALFQRPQYAYTHTYHTHLITEALRLVACVQMLKRNVKHTDVHTKTILRS